jgi:hypothetical protein|tara:strand:+ start:28 stop:579 length:552 start_codon:yes stop_codon:yes gene_type:complete
MQFSDLEKHYILSRAWHEYQPSIVKGMDESASGQVWSSAAASWTDDQRVEFKNFDSLMFQAYNWRSYAVCRLMMSDKFMKAAYPTVPPKVDLKEVEEAGFKKRTFVIGMYIAWFANTLWKKGEDEDQTQFERRKDFHDYEFGYLCKEAITDSTFPREEIHKELGRARDTVNNIASIVYNARNK